MTELTLLAAVAVVAAVLWPRTPPDRRATARGAVHTHDVECEPHGRGDPGCLIAADPAWWQES